MQSLIAQIGTAKAHRRSRW